MFCIESGKASVVTKLSNRNKWICQVGKLMGNAGFGGEMGDVKCACVCRLNRLVVGHGYVDAVGGGCAMKTRAVDGEEVASAGRVGESSRGRGTVTVVA